MISPHLTLSRYNFILFQFFLLFHSCFLINHFSRIVEILLAIFGEISDTKKMLCVLIKTITEKQSSFPSYDTTELLASGTQKTEIFKQLLRAIRTIINIEQGEFSQKFLLFYDENFPAFFLISILNIVQNVWSRPA